MDRPADGKGKCSSCGLLAKIDSCYEGPPPYVYEMPWRDRDHGEMSPVMAAQTWRIITSAQCYINAVDMWKEIDAAMRTAGSTQFIQQTIQQVLQKDRQCPKWHPYTPGFSPQEHLEEIRMQELELDRRKFEAAMNKSNKNFQIFLTVVVLIFAIAEIVMPAAFPSGWPWLMKIFGSQPAVPTLPPMPEF